MLQDQNFEIETMSKMGRVVYSSIQKTVNIEDLEKLSAFIRFLRSPGEKLFLNQMIADKINIIKGLPQFNESGLLIRNGDVLTFWLRYSAVRHCEYLLKLGFDVQIKATGKDYTICKAKKSFQPTQGLSRCFQ